MNKRYLVAATVCAMMILGTVLPAAAAEKASISATGHAQISVKPDVAYITAGIVTTGSNVEAAREENNKIMHRIVSALKSQGIDQSRIITSQFSLHPVYREGKGGDPHAVSGYNLQNNVTVEVEDLEKIGPVIDATLGAGANMFHGLRFALKDDGKVRDELLRKAVQDGHRKAKIIADAMDITLGRPLSVSEGGNTLWEGNAYRDVKAFAAGGTPIEPGNITIGVSVNIAYEI